MCSLSPTIFQHYLNVKGHQDPVQLLLHFPVDHDPPPSVLQPVGGGGLGEGPTHHDVLAVQLGLVGLVPGVEQPDLHQGAGLARPDELLVAVSSGGGPSYREYRRYISPEL